MTREIIRTATGRILGWIETENSGDKIGFDNAKRIVGKYKKSTNTTHTFSGVIAYKGEALSALVINKGKVL